MTFTLQELWLLHAFCRHEMAGREGWDYPPANFELNQDIVHAIHTCESQGLYECMLSLNLAKMLVIDFWIRPDFKSPGATGQDILRKVFKARAQLNAGTIWNEDGHIWNEDDQTWKEVEKKDANASANTSQGADDSARADTPP